jgi:hypothetical protein
VVSLGISEAGRTILAGPSWGGYLTLLGLGTQPQRWSLGIATVPVGDYVAAFEDEMEPLRAFDRALFGGAPDEIPEVYRERSPITYVERVRVPVMILAGENDPRCPIRQIENYVARLRELGTPHGLPLRRRSWIPRDRGGDPPGGGAARVRRPSPGDIFAGLSRASAARRMNGRATTWVSGLYAEMPGTERGRGFVLAPQNCGTAHPLTNVRLSTALTSLISHNPH